MDRIEEIEIIQRERGEGEHEQAISRFNKYSPLLQLGRFDEAQKTLEWCYGIFRKVNDLAGQAKALSALAEIWDYRGDSRQAADLERQALVIRNGLHYPADRSVSHHNLAGYLNKLGQIVESTRHSLADIVYCVITNHQDSLAMSIRNMAVRIRKTTRSGQFAYELPRLADLLARLEFDALSRFLIQSQVDLDALQTVIDDIVEQARHQAFAPEALARDAAAEAVPQLLERLNETATSGQDISPLLAELREQMLIADPSMADSIDAMLDRLRAELTGTGTANEQPPAGEVPPLTPPVSP